MAARNVPPPVGPRFTSDIRTNPERRRWELAYDDDDAREARGRCWAEQDGGSDADDGTSSAAGTSSALLARVVETILGSGANISWNLPTRFAIKC